MPRKPESDHPDIRTGPYLLSLRTTRPHTLPRAMRSTRLSRPSPPCLPLSTMGLLIWPRPVTLLSGTEPPRSQQVCLLPPLATQRSSIAAPLTRRASAPAPTHLLTARKDERAMLPRPPWPEGCGRSCTCHARRRARGRVVGSREGRRTFPPSRPECVVCLVGQGVLYCQCGGAAHLGRDGHLAAAGAGEVVGSVGGGGGIARCAGDADVMPPRPGVRGWRQ